MNAQLNEAPLRRLPFSFAKRHGVVLLAEAEPPCLGHRPGVELVALAEAQRFVGRQLALRALSAEAVAMTEAKRSAADLLISSMVAGPATPSAVKP